MIETLHREVDIEEIWRIVKLNNLIFDGRDSSPGLAHDISVLALSRSSDFEPPVLWLEGNNSFDPYRISEISRNMRLDSERVLEQIYISRAFTCYQMKSLIIEKLGDAVEEYGSGFVVITGLPGLFSRSDLSGREALRVFDPVVEELKSFRKSGPTALLVSPSDGEENEFSSNLRSVSDQIIGFDREKGQAGNSSKDPTPRRRKNTGSGSTAGTRTLEEFA